MATPIQLSIRDAISKVGIAHGQATSLAAQLHLRGALIELAIAAAMEADQDTANAHVMRELEAVAFRLVAQIQPGPASRQVKP